MRKKLMCLCLTVVLILNLSVVVRAVDDTEGQKIYINTEACPEEVSEFAEKNVRRFVIALCEQNGYDIKQFKMGNGFKMYSVEETDTDYFMFPISYQGQFSYLFSVHRQADGHMIPSISGFLVEEIIEASKNSSENSPMTLFTYEENIYVSIEEEITALWELNEDISAKEITLDVQQEVRAENVLDWGEMPAYTVSTVVINSGMVEKNTLENGNVSVMASYPISYFISLSRTEQQGSKPWCCAYAGAAILRTVTGTTTITAAKIAQYAGASSTESISHVELMNYARTCSISTTKSYSTLSASKVKSLISSDSPIYLSCLKGDSSGSKHALVLMGYSDYTSTYSIWNPWSQNQYFIMDMDEKTHYYGDVEWIWNQTIYNW